MNFFLLRLFVSFFCVTIPLSYANVETELKPLPDPLSLEAVLEISDSTHPDIQFKQHAITIAQEELNLLASNTDLDIYAQAEARLVEPAERLRDLGREDHRARLVAEKTIYDFGRTGYQKHAAQEFVEISELELEKTFHLRRLAIMRAFFAVVLADLQFNFDNEAMAIYFIQYDRAKERFELGQLSEIEVLEKQSKYMEIRRDRFKSEAAQRETRVAMSDVLNRPDQIVSQFLIPKLDYHKYQLIELAKLQQTALENNLDLKILRKKRTQARKLLKSLRSKRLPKLYGQAEAGIYSREIGSNDAWRVGVGIDIPLYQGSRVDSALAVENQRIKQLNLQIYQKEQAIKQEILSHWLAIDVLAKQIQSSDVELDYRELYLDRARSLYEMEVKTDLGDSMIALTRATRYEAETQFEIAMKWETLRYLAQMKLEDMRQ